MKNTFFAFAAAAMLMAPLAACGEETTYVPEDLESLGFPDDLEVIVYEPPQTSAAIDLSADKQLAEPDQAATSQDFLDGTNTRHDGPASFHDAIDTRYSNKEAQDAPYGHQTVPLEELRILDNDNRKLPEPSTHDDLPVLSQNDDGTYDAPTEMPQTGDNYTDTLALEDPCLCQGQSCLQDWIDDNIGCDVCVAFMCGETTLGACAVCPADEVLGQ
jgi:hypothetical protein